MQAALEGIQTAFLHHTSQFLIIFRWSRERYSTAQAALVGIMRSMCARGPASCVLRPALREEARKVIGDTGACLTVSELPPLSGQA